LIRKSLLENQFKNVTVFQNAVSKEEEFIFLDSEPGGSNCMSIKADSDYVPELIVQSVTVDDTIPKETKIDLIKIDIEGFEGIAIQGMMKTLTSNRPIIFMEFFPGMLEKFSRINPLTYLETFQTMGYEFKVIPLPHDNKKTFSTKSAEEVLTLMGNSFMVDIIATPIE
jgi:FkbM family methyltransferase